MPPELEDILKDETDDMEIWCDDDSSDEEAVEVKQEASSDDYPVQKTVQTSIDEPEQMQEVYLTTTKTEGVYFIGYPLTDKLFNWNFHSLQVVSR